MITVNAAFGQEEKVLGTLGRIGENETRQIVFDCADILTEYPGAEIICVMQRHCDRTAYLADAVLAGNVLTVTLTDTDVSASGNLRIELRALVDGKIRKSAVYTGKVVSALRGEQDKPGNPTADVLNRIDMTISRAEESIAEANAAAQSARKVANTVQTKLDNGDFVGPAGKPGSDASVTSDNIKTALGYTPVKNVQMNGESLVQDSVATIPLAGYNRLGAVQLDPAGFAAASVEGKLALVPPTDAQISTHTHTKRPITPSCMDYAVKAAMCDGKGAAWTAAEQKAARERMGADGDYVLIESLSLTEAVTRFERNSEPDGAPYNLSALKVIVKFIPGQAAGAFFFHGYDGSGSRIVGGASESISMVPEGSPSDYRSTALMDVKPLFGLYDCTVSQGRQGSAMRVTRSANGSYQLTSTESKIAKFMFYLYSNSEIPMIAGTEIQIYGVRA